MDIEKKQRIGLMSLLRGSFLAFTLGLFVVAFLVVGPSYAEEGEEDDISEETKKKSKLVGHGIVRRIVYDKEHVLTPGDHLRVTLFPVDPYVTVPGGIMENDNAGEVTVDDEGYMRLTLAGRIKVADMTIREAEANVLKVLSEYFVDPDVTIEAYYEEKESEAGSVVLLGQVKNPGTYSLPGGKNKLSIMEAISLGGGYSELANIKKISVARKDESGKTTRIQLNAEDILTGEKEDFELIDGDIVHVKESLF